MSRAVLARLSLCLSFSALFAVVSSPWCAHAAPPAQAAPSGGALVDQAASAYPADSLDELGAPIPNAEAARAALEKSLREAPESERAPSAAFRLGLLQMDPANPRADLGAALSTFEGLIRRAPRSAEAPAALEAAAQCRRLRGEVSAAAGLDVRLLAEYPGDPAASRARLRLALDAAKQGDRDAGRLLPREGSPGSTDRARAAAALLARPKDGAAGPSGELDASFDSPFVKEPVSIAALPGGVLVLDGATGRVVGGSEGMSPPASVDPDPEAPRRRGIAVDPRGRLWIWDEKGVTSPDGRRVEPRAPSRKGDEQAPVRRIAGVAPGLFGTLDVLDASNEQVLRYGPGYVLRGVVALPARPIAAARSEDGTLDVLLESRPRQIFEIRAGAAPAGWPVAGSSGAPAAWETRSIPLDGPEGALTAPVAIARDDLGRRYVLDEDARSVTVLDRKGGRVATYALPRGGENELRAPASIAVDAQGRIYVADRKLGRVVRFR